MLCCQDALSEVNGDQSANNMSSAVSAWSCVYPANSQRNSGPTAAKPVELYSTHDPINVLFLYSKRPASPILIKAQGKP
jgi:hypothetical protein